MIKKLFLIMLLTASAMLSLAGCFYDDGSGSYDTPITENTAITSSEETFSAEETETETSFSVTPEDEETFTSDETAFSEDEDNVITEETQTETNLKFRSRKLLDQHYEKHGREMGFDSPEEYEEAAAAVVSSPDALHKTEAEDGDDVYYIESTNEFVIVSTDGYIRTYFFPSAGKNYFDRQ